MIKAVSDFLNISFLARRLTLIEAGVSQHLSKFEQAAWLKRISYKNYKNS